MGEHQNGRIAMDKLKKNLIDSGYTERQADKKAREVAVRVDRKRRGK